MAQRFRLPSDSLFTDNGKPLAGGTLEFYASGTSTHALVFSDDGLETPAQNPYTLDSAGRHGDIFLAGLLYKVVLKDASGTVIRTMDPVYGGFAMDATQLFADPVETISNTPDALPVLKMRRLIGSSPTGEWADHSNEVAEYFADGWHYSGPPITGQSVWVQSEERALRFLITEWTMDKGVADVRAFGAKGDGETDDTAAFQSAAASGRSIYVSPSNAPDKPYLLSDDIEMSAGTRFYGDGHLSYVKQTVADKNCFIANDDTEVFALRLEGYGGTSGTDFTKGNGVFASGKRNVRIKNNELIGFEACGAQVRGCKDVEIAGNYCRDSYWGAFASSADIMAYSDPGNGKRINIHHNFCLSRNSEGIAVNSLGGDTDVIVDANICVTLAEDGTEAVLSNSDAVNQRRHGIQIGYNGVPVDGDDQRIQVTNNIVRNTAWTGLYCNVGGGAPGNVRTGPFIVTGNQISKAAQVTSGGLSGGIVIYGGGLSDVVTNNIVTDCQYAGGIVFRAEATPSAQIEIRLNTIQRCKRGVYTDVMAGHLTIGQNKIIATLAGNYDIYCGAASGLTTGGGIWITKNRIKRNDAFTSIFVDPQAATDRSFVEDNWIIGVDTTTGTNSTNAAINSVRSETVTVRRNYVKNFKCGVNFVQAISTARILTPICDLNDFENVDVGIMIFANSSEKVVLLEGNTFTSVITKVSGGGGFKAGYIGQRLGDNVLIFQSAAPTVGTWIVGDEVKHTAPAAGGNKGSICTTAGAPGTWKTYGAIAA